MNRFITMTMMLAAVVSMVVATNQVYAKDVVQNCDAKNIKCEFNTEFEKVNGNVNLKQTFDFSGLVNVTSGGGSGGPSIDAQARADNVEQQGQINQLITNASNVAVENAILVQRVGDQADVINQLIENNSNLAGDVAQLRVDLDNAITDISDGGNVTIPGPVDNGTSTGNGTNTGGNGTTPIPPIDNGTSTGNETGPIVVPPIDNGTGTNSTGVGNFTG